jgi:hypothetical protein
VFSHRALSRSAVVFCVLTTAVAPTAAASTGACEGVLVAVDTAGAGSPGVVTRCAPGDPGNARAALERAGFTVHGGTGDVCRVDGLPVTDACDAHWKVWRVGLDPVAWRGSGTGGPSGLRVCPGGLVGFSYGTSPMTVTPNR